jgi:hypothetical protein
MNIFISYINEESVLAGALKDWIESTFAGQCSVFVSTDADGIPPGTRWVERIDQALEDAEVLIVLCSPSSVKRPWVNFEAGCGFIKRVPVIPVCHSGLRKEQLPLPLSIFQAQDIADDDFSKSLIHALADLQGITSIPRVSFADMQAEVRDATLQAGPGSNESQGQSTVLATDKPLEEVELGLLLAVEGSGRHGCDFPSLVQAVGLSETQTKYYLDRLSRDHRFLNWIGNMNPDVPDRYTLTRNGRDFLVENEYV